MYNLNSPHYCLDYGVHFNLHFDIRERSDYLNFAAEFFTIKGAGFFSMFPAMTGNEMPIASGISIAEIEHLKYDVLRCMLLPRGGLNY